MPDYNVYQQPIRHVDANGYTRWRLPNGLYHRLDGPALEARNGLYHRLDGPAVECNTGYRVWYVNGKRHRLDGPAIEYDSGINYWYIDHQELTEQQWTLEVCRRFRDAHKPAA